MKTPLLGCLLLLLQWAVTPVLTAQATDKFTVSGYIKDANSGEELLYANVLATANQMGATTNLYGFYSLTLPKGSYQLVFSYRGYEPLTKTIELNANTDLNVELLPESAVLDEVIVFSKREDVEVDDRLFIASEKLRPAVGFERLEIALDEDEQKDPEDEGRFYDVLFYAFEPQETEDFHLFKFFRNGEQENGDGTFAAVTNDVGLAGKIEGFPLGVYYALGDTARVEMYNISRQAYRYYLDLNNNIGNDGGMFSGQPANVGTNIEGGTLGYFRVAGLAAAEIVVE